MNDDLNDMLNFDPLHEAERITGKSYKEDEGTSGIGLLLQIAHSKSKNEILKSQGETTFSMEWGEWQRAIFNMGFIKVYQDTILRPKFDNEEDIRQVWFHEDGLLLKCDSFSGNRNSATVYYNWKPYKETLQDKCCYTSSGHYFLPNTETPYSDEAWQDAKDNGEIIWSGDHDAREALLFNMNQLRDHGEFVWPWAERPFLFFSNETKDGYENVTEEIIAKLPEEIRKHIPEKK